VVIDNLLSNAFEVAPAHSTLVVTVWSGWQCIELRIRDQGPGMTAESGSTHSTVLVEP
jgi:Histidine kinase-, DNA gyrase B-, and HSP90-like ATPase.